MGGNYVSNYLVIQSRKKEKGSSKGPILRILFTDSIESRMWTS